MNEAAKIVNQFFLQQLLQVSQQRGVFTSDEVISITGMKLLAKDKLIDHSMVERLSQHQLVRPLEQCIRIDTPLDIQLVAQEAERILDTHPAIRPLSGWRVGMPTPSKLFKQMVLQPQAHCMLSIHEAGNSNVLPHFVTVALLAMGLCYRLEQATDERMGPLVVASVFHDIGELYIDPAIVHSLEPMDDARWQRLTQHPLLGQQALQTCVGFDPEIAIMVAQHHERHDGSGYPNGLLFHQLLSDGHLLAVAETMAGIMQTGDRSVKSIYMALAILPGEYARPVIDLLARISSQTEDESDVAPLDPKELHHNLHQINQQLMHATETFDKVSEQSMSSAALELTWKYHDRFSAIQRAFYSTGLNVISYKSALHESNNLPPDPIEFEAALLADELRWRLRELSRQMAAKLDQIMPDERPFFEELIESIRNSPTE